MVMKEKKEKRYLALYSYDYRRGGSFWKPKQELIILGLYKSKRKAEEAIKKDLEDRKIKRETVNCIDYKIVPLTSGETINSRIISDWIYPLN